MTLIGIALLVVLLIAGLVAVFVAFPHRGQSIPHARWLSDKMAKATRRATDKLDI